jgi:hypothetical protein
VRERADSLAGRRQSPVEKDRLEAALGAFLKE